MRTHARRENRQILSFVIGRGHDDDVEGLFMSWLSTVETDRATVGPRRDQQGRGTRGPPSVRSAEICSNEADEKNAGKQDQEHGAVGDPRMDRHVPHSIGHAEQERGGRDWQEYAERTEDGDDLQDDDEEFRAIACQLDL